ncbi:CBL-interacting serine/threonine-protein kinase 1-like [Dorcoceras hygrometricum]|uniref:CBL-interacting serine/threonine-protein kinase 1-like n=1 Tax=Dorcoceras hygrometricum TaxID=472368 RepID=A0A2Z7BKW8_9LAMI|nr:CBL-interacting serine/threonine-protein kinase 1-like [Dorcoceras hygrometricum]
MMNQLVQELRSLQKKKKKIRIISTADESVSSRKVISTADESVSSRKVINAFQQMKLSAKAEATSCFESADEAKREKRSDVVWRISRWIIGDDVIGDVIQSQATVQSADAI